MLELYNTSNDSWHIIVGSYEELKSFLFWLETNPEADGLWQVNKTPVPDTVLFAFYLKTEGLSTFKLYLRNVNHCYSEHRVFIEKGLQLFNEYLEFLKC